MKYLFEILIIAALGFLGYAIYGWTQADGFSWEENRSLIFLTFTALTLSFSSILNYLNHRKSQGS